MPNHHNINYIEIPSSNLKSSKAFFTQVFDWRFVDFGPEYIAIENAGFDGGFYLSDKIMTTDKGSALVVIFSNDLVQTQASIVAEGGKITQEIFAFPGGHRFHFLDLTGNEFAVWSDVFVA